MKPTDMTLLWTFLTILAMLSFEPALAFVTPSPRTFEHTRLSVSTKSDEMSNSSLAVIEYNDFLPRPHPDLSAMDVVQACMTTLIDHPDHGEGLEVCFDFSSDRCRAALGGSLESFRAYAQNPVFGYLVKCQDWKTLSIGPIIKGTPTRGAMQTVLMKAIGKDGGGRTFLWTLQQERRPPRQGCWIIHEVIYVKNAFQLTL